MRDTTEGGIFIDAFVDISSIRSNSNSISQVKIYMQNHFFLNIMGK